MNPQPAPGYQRGDRIALEHASDPCARLTPGTRGTVTGYDPRHGHLHVAWDDGSTLTVLLADGDRVRRLTGPMPGDCLRDCSACSERGEYPGLAECPEHGCVTVVDEGSFTGFAGGTSTWAVYSCGCTDLDESADIRAAY